MLVHQRVNSKHQDTHLADRRAKLYTTDDVCPWLTIRDGCGGVNPKKSVSNGRIMFQFPIGFVWKCWVNTPNEIAI